MDTMRGIPKVTPVRYFIARTKQIVSSGKYGVANRNPCRNMQMALLCRYIAKRSSVDWLAGFSFAS